MYVRLVLQLDDSQSHITLQQKDVNHDIHCIGELFNLADNCMVLSANPIRLSVAWFVHGFFVSKALAHAVLVYA
jgi:hypothetical protein